MPPPPLKIDVVLPHARPREPDELARFFEPVVLLLSYRGLQESHVGVGDPDGRKLRVVAGVQDL